MKKRFFLVIVLLAGFFASQYVDTPTKTPSTPQQPTTELYPVVHIVDGDTIIVSKNGVEEKVRLLGIDTPEVDISRGPAECFGKEATEKTTSLLSGQSVSLESDPTQAERDTYNRLLAYVSLTDGTLINKILVEGGYAKEYTFDEAYTYQADFEAAEKSAQTQKRGLWSTDNCPK